MFGKRVTLLEKHYVVGGLNSFYARKGRKFDVGLHALTNYPSPASENLPHYLNCADNYGSRLMILSFFHKVVPE